MTVPASVTLTIAPGSIVLFAPTCSLQVLGSLKAEGTATDSILFSATDTAARWIGMRFSAADNNGTTTLGFATLQYAHNRRAGGAMHIQGYKGIKIHDCVFRKNSNYTYGGAIFLTESDLTLDRCVFSENHTGSGAGVLYTWASPITVRNCSFTGNSTDGECATVITQAVPTNDRFYNCLFAGNTSGTAEGCINIVNADFVNCTVINNTSTGNGCSITRSQITNSVFWNSGTDTLVYKSNSTLKHSLIESDPLLIANPDGSFTPSVRSPCLDRGTADTTGLQLPATDLAGNARIQCGTIDIGAFERQPDGNCPPVALDTLFNFSWVYGTPLLVDTSLIPVYHYDTDPVHFIIDTGIGYTVQHDTIAIDSGRIYTIRPVVYATDGIDTTRGILLVIKPETPPEIRAVTPQTIRDGETVSVNLSLVDVVDPDALPGPLVIFVHEGEHYSLLDNKVTADNDFFGDLAVNIHVTDGKHSSDTVALTVHVVHNVVPVITSLPPQKIPQWTRLAVNSSMMTIIDSDDRTHSVLCEPGEHYRIDKGHIVPDSSFLGILKIPVRVTDTRDTSESAVLELTVYEKNHPPIVKAAIGGSYVDCSNIVFSMNNVAASDPDHDSISLVVYPGTGYTVDGTTIIPDSCGGSINVLLSVTDDSLSSDTLVVVVTINPSPVTVPPGRPLAVHGKLIVKSGRLCNEEGFPVELKGMSSHGLQWNGDFMTPQSIEWLASDWKASVVRAAMYTAEGGYISKPEVKKKVHEIAASAKAAGVYCIIDWHILRDNDPNDYKEKAISFFSEMALMYKDEQHILYEICNEPNGAITWEGQVRPYAMDLVRAIRAIDSSAVILVGSTTWSQDVDIAARSPLPFDNIAYTCHFYAGTHGDTLRMKIQTALDSGLAIFASEWGTTTANGLGDIFPDESLEWLRFLDSAGISWCNWSLSDDGGGSRALNSRASVLGGWPDSAISVSGTFVRTQMRNNLINDPPTIRQVQGCDTVRIHDSVMVSFSGHDPDIYQKLTWEIDSAPSSMRIDSSGHLFWIADEAGLHTVSVSLTDDSGSIATAAYSVMVLASVGVTMPPEKFSFKELTKTTGDILFRFNPPYATPYRIRIYSIAGRVVSDINGTAFPGSAGPSGTIRIASGIRAAGMYFLEFSSQNKNGDLQKEYVTILNVHR